MSMLVFALWMAETTGPMPSSGSTMSFTGLPSRTPRRRRRRVPGLAVVQESCERPARRTGHRSVRPPDELAPGRGRGCSSARGFVQSASVRRIAMPASGHGGSAECSLNRRGRSHRRRRGRADTVARALHPPPGNSLRSSTSNSTPSPAATRKIRIVDLLRPHWKAMTMALVGVAGVAAADLLEPWPHQDRARLRASVQADAGLDDAGVVAGSVAARSPSSTSRWRRWRSSRSSAPPAPTCRATSPPTSGSGSCTTCGARCITTSTACRWPSTTRSEPATSSAA